MARKLASNAVVKPNLGLYLDRPAIAMGDRMLQGGFNFRVKEGKLSNLNLGWTRLFPDVQLNGPVNLIDNFFLRSGVEILIFGTPTDLYQYNDGDGTVSYITPIYNTGTAAASGTTVTGTTTTWEDDGIKAGDEISFGANDEADPDATWFEIQTVTDNDTLVLTATAGTVVNGPYTIRKKFTGDLLDIWNTAIFTNAAPENEDQWWATNGIDSIVRWNGTDDFVEEMSETLGFRAKVLTVANNMLLYFNLIIGGENLPTDMINSDVGQPAVAGDAGAGLSEQFKIHGGHDGIYDAQPLGDNIAIYSKETVTIAQFVGDPLVFAFRTAVTGIGIVGSRAVADFGNYHQFVARDSQYVFDGVTVKEINQHVWRETLRTQDPSRVSMTYAHFDEENGDLIWVMPSTVDTGDQDIKPPSRALVEHYLEEVEQQAPTPYSLRAFPFTAVGYYTQQNALTWADLTQAWSTLNFRWDDRFFFAAFPLNIAGDIDGKIYSINTAQDAEDAALASYVLFGRRPLFDGRTRGLVSRVYPFATQFTTNLDVTVHMSDHAAGPATINDTQSFDQNLNEGEFFVTPYRRGRFIEVEFGTDGPSQPWELHGYDLDFRQGGKR